MPDTDAYPWPFVATESERVILVVFRVHAVGDPGYVSHARIVGGQPHVRACFADHNTRNRVSDPVATIGQLLAHGYDLEVRSVTVRTHCLRIGTERLPDDEVEAMAVEAMAPAVGT